MKVRYIEYIQIDGEPMSLYIKQESSGNDCRCFRIDVHAETSFDFLLCKDTGNEWKVITQEYPEFIIVKLFEPLTTSIEKRLALEQDYLGLN